LPNWVSYMAEAELRRVTDVAAWDGLREFIVARTRRYSPGNTVEFKDMVYQQGRILERRINVHLQYGCFSVRMFQEAGGALLVHCDGTLNSKRLDLETQQPNKALFRFGPQERGHNCYGDSLEALLGLWLKRVLVGSYVYVILPEGTRAQYIEHTGVMLVTMPKKWGAVQEIFTVFLFDKDPDNFVKLRGGSGPVVACGTVDALIEAIMPTKAV